MVNLTTLIAFWKRKETQSTPEPPRIIPLPPLPGLAVETARSTSQDAANRAREALKLLKLERQILGSAVTTIYESQTKGLISQAERDQLLEKYKVDLKRLEKAIDENQRVVDLFDLESAREELIKGFKAKLAEIDAKVKDLKFGGSPKPTAAAEQKEQKSDQADEKRTKPAEGNDRKDRPSQKEQAKEKKPTHEEDQQISDAEKRVEELREEILKAIDRLEQIEAEE